MLAERTSVSQCPEPARPNPAAKSANRQYNAQFFGIIRVHRVFGVDVGGDSTRFLCGGDDLSASVVLPELSGP
jgi:hypothetical protein